MGEALFALFDLVGSCFCFYQAGSFADTNPSASYYALAVGILLLNLAAKNIRQINKVG